jgi:F-type H+-transporting ATPase subunit b
MAEDASAALQARLERKTRQAEDKIAQAEAQLSQEIRAVSAELAISAAGKLISENMTTETADKILDNSIQNVSSHLN